MARALNTRHSHSAPAALAPKHAWPSDLCHTPPNLCDAEGHLLSLSLRDAGLKCSTFPKELSQLGSLARLDLSGNELQADVKDVAAVRGATRPTAVFWRLLVGEGQLGPRHVRAMAPGLVRAPGLDGSPHPLIPAPLPLPLSPYLHPVPRYCPSFLCASCTSPTPGWGAPWTAASSHPCARCGDTAGGRQPRTAKKEGARMCSRFLQFFLAKQNRWQAAPFAVSPAMVETWMDNCAHTCCPWARARTHGRSPPPFASHPPCSLQVYELSSNFISGTVPACMLSSPVEELYLGRWVFWGRSGNMRKRLPDEPRLWC